MLWQELRFAVRRLRSAPAFAIASVTAIALGTGATTAVISVVETVLLRPLPFADPARLLVVTTRSPQGTITTASPSRFNLWRREATAFDALAAYRVHQVNVTEATDPEVIRAGLASAEFYTVVGAAFVAGGPYSADDDRPGAAPVAVLTARLWRDRFGGDPAVVGRTVSLNGQPHTVVGVLDRFDTASLRGSGPEPAVWTPLQIDPGSVVQGLSFSVVGRLRADATEATARVQMAQLTEQFRARFGGALPPGSTFDVQPLLPLVIRNARGPLVALMAAVSLLLLVACANVANLLMARGLRLQRELAVRLALGGSRGRIARDVIIESLMLGVAGGAIGLAMGLAGIRAVVALYPSAIPRLSDGDTVSLNPTVFAIVTLVVVGSAVICGLVPAWRATRVDVSEVLGSGSRSATPRARRPLEALVVVEVALAVVLLIGTALLLRTFTALHRVDPGFSGDDVIAIDMSLTGSGFTTAAAAGALVDRATERLAGQPGVAAVGASAGLPLEFTIFMGFSIEGRALDGLYHGGGAFVPVSGRYFEALRIPLRRGRLLGDADRAGSAGVVVINEAMAARFWPDGDALGAYVAIGRGMGPGLDEPARQVVGIVGDVRESGLQREPQPAMYLPWSQLSDLRSANLLRLAPLTWVVQTSGDSPAVRRSLQAALHEVSAGLPLARVRTIDTVKRASLSRQSFSTMLTSVFAVLALALAAVGIGGVMAIAAEHRRPEIGLRLALGATVANVRRLLLGQGLRLTLIGVGLGVVLAASSLHLGRSLLFGVAPSDWLSYAAAIGAMIAVALVSTAVPAHRASKVDPARTLQGW